MQHIQGNYGLKYYILKSQSNIAEAYWAYKILYSEGRMIAHRAGKHASRARDHDQSLVHMIPQGMDP